MNNTEDDNPATLHIQGIFHVPPVINLAGVGHMDETWSIKLIYKSKVKRLESFKRWPNQSISKEQLAHAGFYYTGVADIVRCFRCGGGLRNWEPIDDPLEAHERFFPHCDHINDLIRRSNIAQSNEPEVIPGHRDSNDPFQDEKDTNDLKTQLTCRSCKTNQPNTGFIPCYHAVYCWECSSTYTRCPSCNKSISNTFRFSFVEPR